MTKTPTTKLSTYGEDLTQFQRYYPESLRGDARAHRVEADHRCLVMLEELIRGGVAARVETIGGAPISPEQRDRLNLTTPRRRTLRDLNPASRTRLPSSRWTHSSAAAGRWAAIRRTTS
jgi:hypothetical protein